MGAGLRVRVEDGAMTESHTLPSGKTRIESLEMRGITKRFPGVLASDHVNFDVKTG